MIFFLLKQNLCTSRSKLSWNGYEFSLRQFPLENSGCTRERETTLAQPIITQLQIYESNSIITDEKLAVTIKLLSLSLFHSYFISVKTLKSFAQN